MGKQPDMDDEVLLGIERNQEAAVIAQKLETTIAAVKSRARRLVTKGRLTEEERQAWAAFCQKAAYERFRVVLKRERKHHRELRDNKAGKWDFTYLNRR